MKKKFIMIASIILVFVMAAAVFTACDKDNTPKDTFYKGTLSADSYGSSEEAAAAFLANEVCGEATDAEYVSSQKQSDLSASELNELEISAEDRAKITSAQKVLVSYNVAVDAQASAVAAASGTAGAVTTKTVTVYILVIDFDYRYYVPPLKEGDVVTKSYFDEVFDQSKYANATITIDSNTTVHASGYGITQTMSMNIRMDMKCAGKYASFTMTSTDGTDTEVVEMFYVFEGEALTSNFDLYMKYNGVWQQIPTVSIDLDTNFAPASDNDNSYFVKTETGFKLNSEKFNQYLETALEALGNFAGSVNVNSLTANAEYFVNEGRIYSIVASVNADMNVTGASGSISNTTTSTYSNFGTTVVGIPEGLTLSD